MMILPLLGLRMNGLLGNSRPPYDLALKTRTCLLAKQDKIGTAFWKPPFFQEFIKELLLLAWRMVSYLFRCPRGAGPIIFISGIGFWVGWQMIGNKGQPTGYKNAYAGHYERERSSMPQPLKPTTEFICKHIPPSSNDFQIMPILLGMFKLMNQYTV
jgi:hypothetical protein